MADKQNATPTKNESGQRPGFTKEGKPYPGVDPETGARKALTFEGARKEFGPVRGAEVYHKVAMAGGHGRVEGNPDLSLVGLEGEYKAKVDAILAEAEKE